MIKSVQQLEREKYGPNFNYIIRLLNYNLDGRLNVLESLKTIKYLDEQDIKSILDQCNIKYDRYFGSLTNDEIDNLCSKIQELPAYLKQHK